MVFNFIVLFATGWIGISTFVSAVPASQSYASDYYATQSIPSPEPSFSIATRRRINNCDEDWMKGIEAQGIWFLAQCFLQGYHYTYAALLTVGKQLGQMRER